MVQFIIKLAHQIMFWFNHLMGSGLLLFQVVMMTQWPLGDLEDAWLNCFW